MKRQHRRGFQRPPQATVTAAQGPIDELLHGGPKGPPSSPEQSTSHAKQGEFKVTSENINLAACLIAFVAVIGLLAILVVVWDHFSLWVDNFCAEKGGQP